jgi:hypothetical protein
MRARGIWVDTPPPPPGKEQRKGEAFSWTFFPGRVPRGLAWLGPSYKPSVLGVTVDTPGLASLEFSLLSLDPLRHFAMISLPEYSRYLRPRQ